MSLGFKNLGGLTASQANNSVKIADIPGDGGVGPIAFVITGAAIGLPPSSPAYGYQLFPGGHFADGTDNHGDIGAELSASNSGDDKTFDVAGGGTLIFPEGFWASSLRGLLSGPSLDLAECDFGIQFLTADPVLTYDKDIPEHPHNTHKSDPTWDGNKGTVTITTDFDNSSIINPNAIAFYRNNLPLASIPWVDGITSYSYDDVVFAPGTYVYTAIVYKYGSPNRVSDNSNSVSADFGGPPNFTVTGSGGFDLGGSATIIFNIDPSGIYVLVPNKTHDTIYTDVTSGNETTDVAFPTPFIKTFFVVK